MLQSSLKIILSVRAWAFADATIPNAITLSGVYLTWIMVVSRQQGVADIYTFSYLIGAVLTDKLDGMAAKLPGHSTPLGSALDKFRDKFLILSTFYFMSQTYKKVEKPIALLICIELELIFAFEMFLLLIGASVVLFGAKLRTNEFGRRKMGFECSAVISWALFNDLNLFELAVCDALPLGLVSVLSFISLVLVIASAYGQIRDNMPLIEKIAGVIRNYY